MFRFVLLAALAIAGAQAQTRLVANGQGDTYTLINSVLGGGATSENPDCSHTSFGKHIFQGNDGQLNRQVFFFHSHVNQDNDRCQTFDRQRNEVRPDQGGLTAGNGDTVSFSWIFKLDAGFQPSTAFTHIHQLKAQGGDDSMPLITFTPRYVASGSLMELIHVSSGGVTTKVRTAPLGPFLGQWVKVVETARYGSGGSYSVEMRLNSNGQSLLSYSNGNIDMARSGVNYYRPKWGIYRSLNDRARLRDEIVRFNDICLAKGSARCT